MNNNDYLTLVLDQQTPAADGPELKALRANRQAIENVLVAAFGSSPTIKYGGSKAKGTMVLVSYDLDILCYFPRDDDDAGGTLAELYKSVAAALERADHRIDRKRSALRVRSVAGADFHVDVVPGRYIDDDEADVFLHQHGGTKACLKTNPEVHVAHVSESGCVDEICLAKVWRELASLHIKTFVLELAVIDVLTGTDGSLEERVRAMFEAFRDRPDGSSSRTPQTRTTTSRRCSIRPSAMNLQMRRAGHSKRSMPMTGHECSVMSGTRAAM